MDWNGQENFSLSCKLWIGTFSCPFQSTDNFPEWKLAFKGALSKYLVRLVNQLHIIYLLFLAAVFHQLGEFVRAK
jgi:hypothetical protein